MPRADLKPCFDRQRAAYLEDPQPTAAARIADLKALTCLHKENRDAIVEAINLDYGNRSTFETLFLELFLTLSGLREAASHLRRWMQPQRRKMSSGMLFPGASNHVVPQPLGLVGAIVPWNFPMLLSFSPLAFI